MLAAITTSHDVWNQRLQATNRLCHTSHSFLVPKYSETALSLNGVREKNEEEANGLGEMTHVRECAQVIFLTCR